MDSSSLNLAASAASVAANPVDPLSWAGLAKSVGSVLGGFGGSGVYLSNSGYGWTGQVTKNGFTPEKSTAYTILSDGTANNWAPGANASWHDVFDPLNKAFANVFQSLGDKEITLQARSGTTSTGLTNSIANQFASYFGKSTMDTNTATATNATPAPDLTAAPIPAGTINAAMPGSVGGGSTVAPDPKVYPQAAPATAAGPDLLTLGLLAAVGYYLWTHNNG